MGSYRDRVGDGGGGFDGVYIMQRGHERKLWQAGWKGDTIFRPYPALTQDRQGIFPARLSTKLCDFSDWITAAEAVTYTGQLRKLSFISEWPGMNQVDESPAKRIHRVVNAAFNNNVRLDWKDFVIGRMCHLQRPGICCFMQGHLLVHNGKKVDRHGVVLLLKQSGRYELEKMMSAVNPSYKHPGDASPVDLEQYFSVPDPTDPDKGYYLVIKPNEATKERQAHYSVNIGDSCRLDMANVLQNWQPWDEILKYSTPEEQVVMLMTALPPDMLWYAFHETPLLPKDFIESFKLQQEERRGQELAEMEAKVQAERARMSARAPAAPANFQNPASTRSAAQPGQAKPLSAYGVKPLTPTNIARPPQDAQPNVPGQPSVAGAFSEADAGEGPLPGFPIPEEGQLGPEGDLDFPPSEDTTQPAQATFMGNAAAKQAPSAVAPGASKAAADLAAMNRKFTQGGK